jgi:hypothetical protein
MGWNSVRVEKEIRFVFTEVFLGINRNLGWNRDVRVEKRNPLLYRSIKWIGYRPNVWSY